ncbi:mucin-17 [Aplysia californica]|uniref:Mucin-17 n=1 Tax=Aplysia californica TaxID=6500 RepID=A0ABM0JJ34_APLCA|nr:mucin-17 [Aplysia californica]
MFLSRHDLSFHFIYCDPRIVNLIGYEPKDVLGRTVYQFHCPRDVIMCMHCHRSLMTNGSVKSTYYRFLSRTGAWVWLITHATIVYDTAQKPQYIVCRNYVVTHEEAERALSRDKSEFNRMRCLGFSLETELPLPKSVTVPKQLTMAHFSPLKPVDPLKRLDSIFSIPPVDVSSNPYVRRGRKSMRFEDDDFENPLVESRHESQRSDCSDSVISNSTVDSMQASTGVSDSPVMSIQTDRRLSQLSDTFSAYSGSCCMDIVPSSASTMLTVPQDSAMSETDLGTLDLGDEYTLSPDSDMIITQSDLSSGGLQPLKLQDLGQSPRMQNKTNVSTSVNDSLSNLNVMASLSSSMSVAKENDVLNAPFQSNQNIDPNSMLSDFSSFIMPEPGPQNFVDDLFAEETNIEGNLQNVLPMSGNMNTQHGVGTADEVNTSESFPGNFDLMWQSTPSVQVSIGEDFSAGLSSSQEGAQIAGNAVTLTSSPSTSLHNSQLPPSSLYSTPGEVESFLCGITDRITRKSIDFPSVYGQEEVEAADLLNETDVTTLLTNNGSDPFLNGMSMDTSEFPTDLDTNFTLKSTIPSCLSSQSPSLNEKSSMNASQGSPVSKITFMSSFDPTVMNSNKSSRPNQCSTLCFGVGGSNTCINICTPSSGSVSQASDNQFIPSQQTSASPPRASLGLEYESETLRRQSLLRTLLDKGETVQGPLTHEEWILTQSLSKQNDPKKDKCTKNEREVQATSKRHKIVKNGGRKSTELPLPQSSSLSSTSKFRKGGCDGKMKTKELPLPLRPCTSVSVTAGENRSNQLFSTCHQGTAMMQEQANYDSMANQQVPSERHIEMEDFDFPDDLLDLDVESCGPIGHDQAQALISDLSSNASWEDSLYTFIEAQIKAQVSSCMDQAPSQTPVTSTLASLPVQSSASCHGQGTSMSSSPPVGSPTGKTSLLRAAVTNPDMDKLIEQFPFHTAQTFSSQMPQQTQELPPCGPTVAQKVAAYEQSIMGSSPPLHTSHKVNCKISAPMKSPARMISSEKSDHEQSYFSNSKSPKTMSIFGKSPCSAAANVMRTSASPATSFPPQMSQMRRSTPQKSFSPPQTSPTSRSKTSSPRGSGSADPSSSSSEPVSVMVLRKESGRSRKSKSIAIQTESNSQEVYPEFELSASDTVMYPSVSFSSPPEASRRTPALSVPSPASSAASPSMTELEKFLRGQSDAQDGSTHDGNSRDGSGAGTPFLQRLLTGELSRDNYQRLDQQMMEEERRETAFPSARCEMREHNFS